MTRVTRSPEENEDIKYFENNELEAFFRVIKSKRDTALFRLAYHRGLRAREVGLLQLMDLDRTNIREWTLHVTRLKGSKSGRFPLLAAEQTSLRAYLRERGDHPGPLFASRLRSPISQQQLDRLTKGYCELAGIAREKAMFKSFRHSCGTALIERDVPIDYVAAHLGHRSIKNTMIYVHLRNTRKSEIAQTKLRDWK